MTARKYPRHDFWGAGEPDCPADLKASNGELCDMRCKVCGDGWRESPDVCMASLVVLPAGLVGRVIEKLEYPGPSWIEHRAELAAELRAAAGVPPSGHVVPDAVWEALQRLIENAETLGPASKEDALLVARWRARFVPAREAACGGSITPRKVSRRRSASSGTDANRTA